MRSRESLPRGLQWTDAAIDELVRKKKKYYVSRRPQYLFPGVESPLSELKDREGADGHRHGRAFGPVAIIRSAIFLGTIRRLDYRGYVHSAGNRIPNRIYAAPQGSGWPGRNASRLKTLRWEFNQLAGPRLTALLFALLSAGTIWQKPTKFWNGSKTLETR